MTDKVDYRASFEEAIKLLGEYKTQLSEKEKQLSEAVGIMDTAKELLPTNAITRKMIDDFITTHQTQR